MNKKEAQQLLLKEMYDGDYRYYISLMQPVDKKWLMDIAEAGNVFVFWCLIWGMNRSLEILNHATMDEDAEEEQTFSYREVCKPIFPKSQPDEDMELMGKICTKAKDITTEDLNAIWKCADNLGCGLNYLPLLIELDRRYGFETDDHLMMLCLEAIERLGDIYTWGDEQLGVLSDSQKAKAYYERCGSQNVWD